MERNDTNNLDDGVLPGEDPFAYNEEIPAGAGEDGIDANLTEGEDGLSEEGGGAESAEESQEDEPNADEAPEVGKTPKKIPLAAWVGGGVAILGGMAGIVVFTHHSAGPAPVVAMKRPTAAETQAPGHFTTTPVVSAQAAPSNETQTQGSFTTMPAASTQTTAPAEPSPAGHPTPSKTPAVMPGDTGASSTVDALTATTNPTPSALAPTAATVAPAPASGAPRASQTNTRLLRKLIAQIGALQKRLAAPQSSSARPTKALILRLRTQRDAAWRKLRVLERSREQLIMQIVRLRRKTSPPVTRAATANPTTETLTPWQGWSLAGLSARAVILRNTTGDVKILQPGQTFRGIQILSIQAHDRTLLTSEGPIVLPSRRP